MVLLVALALAAGLGGERAAAMDAAAMDGGAAPAAAGPPPGRPALVPAGMMGDRVFLVFADPGEISTAIEAEC